jgi:hypothetical protein
MKPLRIIAIVLLVLWVQGQGYSQASNIDAFNVVLYTLSSNTMPDQIFPLLFRKTFTSTPTFAFGINQYRMGDQFYI